MDNPILHTLVKDAELVAGVGLRLGRMADISLLSAIDNARLALSHNKPTAQETMDLQNAMNGAMRQLAPITLTDLQSGWLPFQDSSGRNISTVAFAIFSLLLLFATAYMTQVYHRANLLYQTTLELESSRGHEQAVRLFGLLKKNQKDVIDSLTSGNKDFLYESFNKSLSDLTSMNIKALAYIPMATDTLCELDFTGRLLRAAGTPVTVFTGDPEDGRAISDCYHSSPTRYQIPENLRAQLTQPALPPPAVIPPSDLSKLGIQPLLAMYFSNLRDFTSSINVGFDPIAPVDYSYYKFRFQQSLSLLGFWILPGLYGMLGAIIFLMRRVLDPTLPRPTWLRFPFRVILGGFAGIVTVWLFSPTSLQPTLPHFATLGAFGLAFIIGYSTDFFFMALDRLVNYLSQAVEKSSG